MINKRLFSICLILGLLIFGTQAMASSVLDMPTGWSYPAVSQAVSYKILTVENGYVRPMEMLTRAEMACGIVNVFGATAKADLSEYIDISSDSPYYDAMSKAVAMGVISGYGNGKLRPEANITREELFTVLYRALGLQEGNLECLNRFNDKELISDWSKGIVARMVENQYVSGNNKGNIRATEYISRQEFAQVMKNIFTMHYRFPIEYKNMSSGGGIIKVAGVVLSNYTINGDLIIADGVGSGTIMLNNVTVNGRILIRDEKTNLSLSPDSIVKEGIIIIKSKSTIEEDNSDDQNVLETTGKILTLSYNLSGGLGEIQPVKHGLNENEISCEFTISEVKPIKIGYEFLGWSDEKNSKEAIYIAGDKIVISRNKTLYAVWK